VKRDSSELPQVRRIRSHRRNGGLESGGEVMRARADAWLVTIGQGLFQLKPIFQAISAETDTA
jgi:hypothetical protein